MHFVFERRFNVEANQFTNLWESREFRVTIVKRGLIQSAARIKPPKIPSRGAPIPWKFRRIWRSVTE
jgi:hypothetical protein